MTQTYTTTKNHKDILGNNCSASQLEYFKGQSLVWDFFKDTFKAKWDISLAG